MFVYYTSGTCSRQIIFEVDENNKIHCVKFIGGCSGNLQGVGKLVEGHDIDEIEKLFRELNVKTTPPVPINCQKQ